MLTALFVYVVVYLNTVFNLLISLAQCQLIAVGLLTVLGVCLVV